MKFSTEFLVVSSLLSTALSSVVPVFEAAEQAVEKRHEWVTSDVVDYDAAEILTGKRNTKHYPAPDCLSAVSAAYLVNGYATLLNSTFSPALAAFVVTSNFTEYSDSINFLAGLPYGKPTFSSRAAFQISQGFQPPFPFKVVEINAITCKTVAYRWTGYPGSGQYPAAGLTILNAERNCSVANGADGWQIATQYVEFNVGAYNVDLGGVCTPAPLPAGVNP